MQTFQYSDTHQHDIHYYQNWFNVFSPQWPSIHNFLKCIIHKKWTNEIHKFICRRCQSIQYRNQKTISKMFHRPMSTNDSYMSLFITILHSMLFSATLVNPDMTTNESFEMTYSLRHTAYGFGYKCCWYTKNGLS